jgi:cytochrome P450
MNDPARFANPETFDLHRADQIRPHLVFGAGPHRCLGEMLARIELEESLAALMDAAPGMEMIEAPHVTGYGGIRRTSSLIARI